jgi:hypothetical protein
MVEESIVAFCVQLERARTAAIVGLRVEPGDQLGDL